MIGAIIGTIAIVVVVVAIGLFVDKKVPLLPRPEPKPEPARPTGYGAGEVAATAIRAGAAQLAELRKTQRCTACSSPMAHADDDPVRYDDRDLLVLHFRCTACGATRFLYVEPLTDR